MDTHFLKLHSELKGIGIQVKHTEIVTKEDKMKLWTSGVMGLDTPKSLQNAAFYVVGKMFSLRGGVEHRSLKLSQITRMSNPDQYIYYENVYQLMSGLLRYMREANPNCPNYLNKQDTRFQPLQHTLDAHFHKLHSEGIGIQVKHTEIVTKEDEMKLWTSEVTDH